MVKSALLFDTSTATTPTECGGTEASSEVEDTNVVAVAAAPRDTAAVLRKLAPVIVTTDCADDRN